MCEVYKMYKVCKVYKVLLPPTPQASYPTSVGFIGIEMVAHNNIGNNALSIDFIVRSAIDYVAHHGTL